MSHQCHFNQLLNIHINHTLSCHCDIGQKGFNQDLRNTEIMYTSFSYIYSM